MINDSIKNQNPYYKCPEQITAYLQGQNLNIKEKGKNPASRFIDQKVTPDVLSVIASVITNLDPEKQSAFTSSDIWNSEDFEAAVSEYFSKPLPTEKTAANEYDKFIGQCLNTLNFSGVIELIGKSRAANRFRVRNSDVLKYIASHDRNAYIFIVNFLKEVLIQSDLSYQFEKFLFENNTQDGYMTLKDQFDSYLKSYTNISESNFYESKRIFTKVLNPLAHYFKKDGTRKGRISKSLITYDELLYNRLNWRDTKKEKNITRQQFQEQHESNPSRLYLVQKAKNEIKSFHSQVDGTLISEVKDGLEIGTIAVHVHHIFPESQYPELSDRLENLILLTPSQHLSKAHPNGNTGAIDREYQKVCLLSKFDTITDPKYAILYSITSFIEMIEIAMEIDIPENPNAISMAELRRVLESCLDRYYSS